MTKILEEAKKLLGKQFNEEAWKNQIEADESRAKEQLKMIKGAK